MTDLEIEAELAKKIREERRITREVLELIILSEDRRIYAERGYPSLFEWLTKRFGYSEGAANRRISAARLLRSVPEASEKLESGDLNLTTMAKAQSIIRAQEKAARKEVSPRMKAQALETIERKATVKAEQELLAMFPEAATQVKQERVVAISEYALRLNSTIPNEVMERFKKVRDKLSHRFPNATFVDLADYFFREFLQADADKNAAAAKQRIKNENKILTPRTRRIVLREGQCRYQDPVTGKTCAATAFVQIDHRIPRAHRGTHHGDNLRSLCATHNRLMAEKILGKLCANRWREKRHEHEAPELKSNTILGAD